MLAIISDIHSNAVALQAVLEDIDSRGISKIYCLGDIVGYGPQPGECLDMIAGHVTTSILGNHDHAVLYGPENFNLGAESAVFWTRATLENEKDNEIRSRRWEFLASLPERLIIRPSWPCKAEEMLLVHGSPRKPITEYIFPDDPRTSPNKMSAIFERFSHACFVGHTHMPGVFYEEDLFIPSEELPENRVKLTSDKMLINVGSVGQPRDRNPRACYVIVHDDVVEFIRIEYNVDNAAMLIFNTDGLDNFLGMRLKEGR